MQSSPMATPRILEISSETLAAGSTPPCPGLAPWLILSSTILIWSSLATRANSSGLNDAVAVAAAEIAGADFPDDVAAVLAVIGTDAALAGVMREAALLGAGIQRPHRVGAERAKTHRRDVEDRGRIRLGAIRAADGDAKLLDGTRLRRHRMVHPFIAVAIDVLLGAERPLVEHHLGALIDQRRGCRGRTACRPSRSRRNTAASPA